MRYLDHLAPGRPVLDVGAGQGRNTLPVARAGISVVALDPSRVGLKALRRRAEAENLPVTPVLGGFEEHDAPPGHYGGALAFGLILDLDWSAIYRLRDRCVHWLAGRDAFRTSFYKSFRPPLVRLPPRIPRLAPPSPQSPRARVAFGVPRERAGLHS